MNQLFIGIIVVLGLGGYYLYQSNLTLEANNAKLSYAVEEQKATITAIKENFEKQTKALQNMTRKNAEIDVLGGIVNDTKNISNLESTDSDK